MNSIRSQAVLVCAILAVGFLLGWMSGTLEDSNKSTETASSMQHTMDAMTASLAGKSGDELDHAFLDEMIVHHEGAVDMAKMVENTTRPELRTFADAIIAVQSQEIAQMKAWRAEWFGEHAHQETTEHNEHQ